jgi:hypothetical protein
MKRFAVAYVGAPQSEKKIDSFSDELAALEFFRSAPHSNSVIVSCRLLGRNVSVFTTVDLQKIDPRIAVDRLTELAPPPRPDVKEGWPLRLLGYLIKGRYIPWR